MVKDSVVVVVEVVVKSLVYICLIDVVVVIIRGW